MYRYIARAGIVLSTVRNIGRTVGWLFSKSQEFRSKASAPAVDADQIHVRNAKIIFKQTKSGTYLLTVYDPKLNAIFTTQTAEGVFQTPELHALEFDNRVFRAILSDAEKTEAFMKIRPFRKQYNALKRKMRPLVKDNEIVFGTGD